MPYDRTAIERLPEVKQREIRRSSLGQLSVQHQLLLYQVTEADRMDEDVRHEALLTECNAVYTEIMQRTADCGSM